LWGEGRWIWISDFVVGREMGERSLVQGCNDMTCYVMVYILSLGGELSYLFYSLILCDDYFEGSSHLDSCFVERHDQRLSPTATWRAASGRALDEIPRYHESNRSLAWYQQASYMTAVGVPVRALSLNTRPSRRYKDLHFTKVAATTTQGYMNGSHRDMMLRLMNGLIW
jgi:hypothetical protein